MTIQGGASTKHSRYATRVKLISVGDKIDDLFDEQGRSRYDVLAINHDKVTDVEAMLAYCKAIENRAEQVEHGVPPLIVVYYSTGINWRNFSQTVERCENFGISTCFEKEGEALADLECAFVREREEHDAQHERHMRSLFPSVLNRKVSGRDASLLMTAQQASTTSRATPAPSSCAAVTPRTT